MSTALFSGTPVEITAAVFGYAALACTFVGFSCKKRTMILLFRIITSACWLIHFPLLGAYTVCVANGIAILRELLFFNSSKKWTRNKAWLVGFICTYIVSTVLLWEGIASIFSLIAATCDCLAVYSKKTIVMRSIFIIGLPFWIAYTCLVNSMQGIIANSVALTITVVMFVYELVMLKKSKRLAAKPEVTEVKSEEV